LANFDFDTLSFQVPTKGSSAPSNKNPNEPKATSPQTTFFSIFVSSLLRVPRGEWCGKAYHKGNEVSASIARWKTIRNTPLFVDQWKPQSSSHLHGSTTSPCSSSVWALGAAIAERCIHAKTHYRESVTARVGRGCRGEHLIRPHHFVIFVLKHMAMPHVAP
jgi:hypothetical protein